MKPYVRALQALVVVGAMGLGAQARAAPSEYADKIADQGYKAYEAGKFADAVSLYSKAFQTSGDPRLLYNIASIYDRKLKDRVLAEDFYRRYLTNPNNEPNLVKKATERLAELKGEDDREKPAAAAAAAPPPPPPRAPEKKAFPLREAGVVVGGVGLVFVIVGSAFGVAALSKSADVRDDCPNDVCAHAASAATRDTASHDATASTVFWGLGLAAIGGGVAMVFLDPKTRTKGPFKGLFTQRRRDVRDLGLWPRRDLLR